MHFIQTYITSLLWCIYAFTIGTLRKKDRVLVYLLSHTIRAHRYPPTKQELPVIDIAELTDGHSPITLVELPSVQGNATAYEVACINKLVQHYAPGTIFEFGTFDGRTTLNMAISSPLHTTLYTIDLPKNETDTALLDTARSDNNLIVKNVTGERFLSPTGKKLVENRTITQLLGDTATFDFAPFYNSIDFIFVDAAHTYEYVKNDSDIALKLLKNGTGVILWHDYDEKHNGSVQAINELYRAHPDWNMFHIRHTNIAGLIAKNT